MQENKFEKKVQQKMDEFRLRPSEAVWEKVEEALRKKKRRRVGFFIFLLAGLSILGYSGYFFFNNSKQNLVDQNTTLSQKESAKEKKAVRTPAVANEDTRLPRSISKQQENSKDINSADKVNSTLSKADKTASKGSVPVIGSKAQRKNDSRRDRVNKDVLVSKTKTRTQQQLIKQPGVDSGMPLNKPDALQNELTEKRPEDKKDIAQTDIGKTNPQDKIQEVIEEDKKLKTDTSIAKTQGDEKIEQAPIAHNKKRSKISWGFDFSAGMADSRETAFSFSDGRQKSMDSYASPNNQGAYAPPLGPSPIEPGIAFKLGPVGKLSISKRSSVSFGIEYAYMSSKMQVGTYTYTTVLSNSAALQSSRVNTFYRGIHQQDFTNRYHFVQMPLQYHLQLNKGKKLPILWDVGLSPAYLLATNALSYDTAAGGVYYRDKDAFNRFQFNLATGFSFRFGNAKKLQWSVGPELSLGMNKLMKDAYDSKQYLLYGGLKGRLIFSKKK